MKITKFLFLITIISALILTGCLELIDKRELGNVSIPVVYINHKQLGQSSTFVGYYYQLTWETAEEAITSVYYRESVDGDSDDEGWNLVEGTISVNEDNPRIKEIVSNDNTYFLSNFKYDVMFVSEIEEYSGKKIMEGLFTVGKTEFVDGIEGVFEYNEESQPAGLDGNFYVGIWNQSEISGPPYNYEVISYEELDSNNQAPFFVGGYYETEYKLAIWREFDGNSQPDIDLPKTEAIYIHPGVVLINKPSADQQGGTIIEDVCLVSDPTEVPNQVLYIQQPDQGTTIDPGIEAIDFTMAVKNQWGFTYDKIGIISFEPTNPDISLNSTALDYNPSISIEPVHSVKLSTDEVGVKSTRIKAWFEGFKVQTEVLSNTIYLSNVNIKLTIKYDGNNRYDGDIIIKVVGSSDGGITYDIPNSTIVIDNSEISYPNFVYDLTDDEDPIVAPGNHYLVYGFRDFNAGNIGDYDINTDAYGEFTLKANNQDMIEDLVLNEVEIAKKSIITDFAPAGNVYSGDTINNVKIELYDQWGNLYNLGTETISITTNESGIDIIPSVSPLETSIGELITDITFKKTQSGNQTGDIIFTWLGTSDPLKTATYNDLEIRRNTISGNVTYNDDGLVPSGNIIIELWDNVTFTGTRLARNIRTYAGSGDYSFNFNAPDSGAGVEYYIRAYRDYNGDENYDDTDDELREPYFEYTTPIEVNHTNVNVGNIGTFDNGDIVFPRQITSLEITQPSTYTELKSGNNVSVTITSRDQWGNVFGDTSESLNFNWNSTPSGIGINPSTGITVEGDGTTSATLTLTANNIEESNRLYVELDSDNTINNTSSNNIKVDGRPPSWSVNPTITQTNPDSIDLRVRINENGKVYYGIYASGATPSVADIVAGTGSLANGVKDPLSAGINHTFNNIGSLSSETDYEVFAVAEDTLGNRQGSEYQISFTTGDNTPPSWEGTTPYIDTNIGETTADLIVQINEAGTVYYAVYLGSAPEPTVADLISGAGSITNGSNGVSASAPYTFNITGLSSNTSYRVYAVAEDTSGNTQTSPLSYDDFQTVDLTPPSWEASTPSLSGVNDDSVDLTVQINEAGTVYYVVVADGSTAPTSAEVKAGTATGQILSGSQVLLASTSTNINDIGSGLLASGTSYDMYIVAEDDETTPNIQASPVLRGFTTTTSSDTTPPDIYDVVAFAGTKTVIITFDEDIVSTAINHDDFIISLNGSAPGVITINTHTFGQKTLILSLTGGNLVSTDDLDITFTKNLGAGIQDTSSNELTNFTYNNVQIY